MAKDTTSLLGNVVWYRRWRANRPIPVCSYTFFFLSQLLKYFVPICPVLLCNLMLLNKLLYSNERTNDDEDDDDDNDDVNAAATVTNQSQ